jgi:tetratricopeptide (TPR) repeat protein
LRRERGDPAAAVEVLAAGLKQFPGNKEISDAYGKLLIETGRAGEGGKYLSQAASHSPHGTDSLELLVTDAIHAKKWKAAAGYVSRLLELKSDEQTLQQAYVIYRALDDTNKVIEYARKLHESAPSNGRYLLEYVRGLMSAGEKTKAKRVIRENLNDGQVPSVMSSLYYLRSEMRSDRALQLQDLLAALFENLENENALIAITRYYIRSGDFRSARTYARQALVFLPSGEQLPSDVAKVLAPGR